METNLLDLVGQQTTLPSCHYIKSANVCVLTWGPDSPQIYIYREFYGPGKTHLAIKWLDQFYEIKRQYSLAFMQEDKRSSIMQYWRTLCECTPITSREYGYCIDFTSMWKMFNEKS